MTKLVMGDVNQMKIFKFLFVIPLITLIIIFQTSLQNRYLLASDVRNGEDNILAQWIIQIAQEGWE